MSGWTPKTAPVALGTVFERVNKKGQRYLAGRLGAAKLLIVETTEVSKGERAWQVFVGEAPYTDVAMRGTQLAQVED